MTGLARYFQKDTVRVDRAPLSIADNGSGALAQGIQQAGNVADDIAARDDDFFVKKSLLDAETQVENLWSGSIENAAPGGAGFHQSFMGNADKAFEKLRASAPTSRAARALGLGLDQIRAKTDQRARAFEIEQKYLERLRVTEQQADNLAQHAFRDPGVPEYMPHGSGLIPPAGAGVSGAYIAPVPGKDGTYPATGWQSRFYSPRDFADGANIQDKSGGVMIDKAMVAKLDWVTEQFGRGKLQINSGYRSPASNVRRATSGIAGPHTKGKAIDIHVSDLSQAEKNRLYSLFKVQGFNAFGFGHGVLHAEIRDGDGGKGRGGDYEWTYGNAAKYDFVPVVGGNSVPVGQWSTANQYPYLSFAKITARAETGRTSLPEASATIAQDTGGTRSYGIFGLNSGGTIQQFISDNPNLGLTEKPGTDAFDAQWESLVASSPQTIVKAQLEWHERRVVRPAQRSLAKAGFNALSNDPRAVAFVADMVVQYGAGGVGKHLSAASGASTVEQFIGMASQSMRQTLASDFRSFLASNPASRKGLEARIDKRASDALTIAYGDGQPVTGNVPLWNGPAPKIEDVPGYSDRMASIDGLIDTMGGTPSQRAQARDQIRRRVVRGWLTALAQRNPSAAMAALHSGQYDDALAISDEVALSGVAEETQRRHYREAQAVEREHERNAKEAKREAEAAQREYDRAVQKGWSQYRSEVQDSYRRMISELKAETNQLVADEAASIAATGQGVGAITERHEAMMTDDHREMLDLARFQHDVTQRVKHSRTDELPGILEALEPAGEDFALEQKKYEFAQGLVAERMKLQHNDPAGYAVQSSEPVGRQWAEAMRSNDPGQIQAAIRAIRLRQRDQGVPDARVRSITQSSADNNARLLSGAENPDAAFSNYMQMRELYGPEFGAVLNEMEADGGPKGWASIHRLVNDGQAVLAKSLARIVHADQYGPGTDLGVRLADQGQTAVARTIFDGQVKRIEVKGLVPKGDSADGENRDEITARVLGDALNESPSVLQAVRESSVNFYANSSGVGEELDGERLEAALQSVTGGILGHNDDDGTGMFVAPVHGMDQETFDKLLRHVRDDDLRGAFVGYSEVEEPVTRRMLIGELQFVSAANGVYYLRYPGAGLVRTDAGLPYEFDFTALMPTLVDRANKAPSGLRRRQGPSSPPRERRGPGFGRANTSASQ